MEWHNNIKKMQQYKNDLVNSLHSFHFRINLIYEGGLKSSYDVSAVDDFLLTNRIQAL